MVEFGGNVHRVGAGAEHYGGVGAVVVPLAQPGIGVELGGPVNNVIELERAIWEWFSKDGGYGEVAAILPADGLSYRFGRAAEEARGHLIGNGDTGGAIEGGGGDSFQQRIAEHLEKIGVGIHPVLFEFLIGSFEIGTLMGHHVGGVLDVGDLFFELLSEETRSPIAGERFALNVLGLVHDEQAIAMCVELVYAELVVDP